jgi:hypothetical protein
MRNLLAVVTVLFSVSLAGAACYGPYCYDDSKAYMDKVLEVPTSGIRFTSVETISVGVSTPTAAGLLGIDATYVLHISTGTGRGAWVKIGGQ